ELFAIAMLEIALQHAAMSNELVAVPLDETVVLAGEVPARDSAAGQRRDHQLGLHDAHAHRGALLRRSAIGRRLGDRRREHIHCEESRKSLHKNALAEVSATLAPVVADWGYQIR